MDTSIGRLAVTLAVGEAVHVGDARVKVVRRDKSRVVLAIEAPKEVPIVREELLPERPE